MHMEIGKRPAAVHDLIDTWTHRQKSYETRLTKYQDAAATLLDLLSEADELECVTQTLLIMQ